MNDVKDRKHSGVTYLSSRLARSNDMHDNGSNEGIPTFGGNGGGGMDNLDRRVSALEDDVKVIRNDLTTLMVRSENFATKADVSDIRTEIATLSGSLQIVLAEQGGSLRAEIADQGGSLRAEMSEMRGDLRKEMADLRGEFKAAIIESQQIILDAVDKKFDKIAENTRWKWGTVFIPLAVGVAGVLATLLAARLSS